MFPQTSARTRSVYGTTCWRRESCAYLQQILNESVLRNRSPNRVKTLRVFCNSLMNFCKCLRIDGTTALFLRFHTVWGPVAQQLAAAFPP
jgi:hypothetical protein